MIIKALIFFILTIITSGGIAFIIYKNYKNIEEGDPIFVSLIFLFLTDVAFIICLIFSIFLI